jgi:preprotein translocase subunit SecG
MGILRAILITIEIICSVLLIGLILLQKSKDEGLGLAFGVGVGETLFGSRAGNVLTKITIGLAALFLVNTVLIGLTYRGGATTGSVTDALPADRPAAAQPVTPGPAQVPLTGGDAGGGAPIAPVPVAPGPATPAPAPAPSGGTP